jgi:hypothetical protein
MLAGFFLVLIFYWVSLLVVFLLHPKQNAVNSIMEDADVVPTSPSTGKTNAKKDH